MWRRTTLFLVLVRLWFALSPSYLHPDENFQGPEVIAGMFLASTAWRIWGRATVAAGNSTELQRVGALPWTLSQSRFQWPKSGCDYIGSFVA